MARASKATGTALAQWDEELAQQANVAAAQEASAAGGGFFSIRGAQLTFQGNALPNNEMAVIICDSRIVNEWYDQPFDEKESRSPVCFALGQDDNTIAPHEDAPNPQSDACKECALNKYGTADVGKGKACKNTRRLALIPAGNLDKDGNLDLYEPEYMEQAAFGWMKVPPTSTRGYAAFVDQLKTAFKRPPHAFVTHIKVEGDRKNVVKVSFNAIYDIRQKSPNLLPIVMARHAQAAKEIEFTYPPNEGEGVEPRVQGQRRRAGKVAGTEPAGRSNAAPRGRKAREAPALAARKSRGSASRAPATPEPAKPRGSRQPAQAAGWPAAAAGAEGSKFRRKRSGAGRS